MVVNGLPDLDFPGVLLPDVLGFAGGGLGVFLGGFSDEVLGFGFLDDSFFCDLSPILAVDCAGGSTLAVATAAEESLALAADCSCLRFLATAAVMIVLTFLFGAMGSSSSS